MERLRPKWGLYRFFMRDLYNFLKSYRRTHYDLDGMRLQTCKECGVSDGYDFHVSNKVWRHVTPHDSKILCLRCFDIFATRKGFDYRSHLNELCFAGDIIGIELEQRAVAVEVGLITHCRSDNSIPESFTLPRIRGAAFSKGEI